VFHRWHVAEGSNLNHDLVTDRRPFFDHAGDQRWPGYENGALQMGPILVSE
jgi:hypothetical protein